MWIETQSRDLVNLDMCSSINLDFHNEKYLIWANGDDFLLGVYSTEEAVAFAYRGIIQAIKDNEVFCKMPSFTE